MVGEFNGWSDIKIHLNVKNVEIECIKLLQFLNQKNKNMDAENIIRKIKLGNFIINMDLKNNTFEQFQEYCKKLGVEIIMQDGICKVVEK